MSEKAKFEVQEPPIERPQTDGHSRRRLMRAGLSAAPVMLAFKSQSVLATGYKCVKPSAFSSIKAAANVVQSHMQDPNGFICKSHGYWKNASHPSPYSNKSKSYFLTKIPLPSGYVSAGFTANPGNAYTNAKLQDVLANGGNAYNAALARHVVGTFLTAAANFNDPTKVLLTMEQCRLIWDSQGTYSPVAGATWVLQDWLDYFDYAYN